MRLAGKKGVRGVHRDVKETHPLQVDFQDGYVRTEAGRHPRGVDPGTAAPDYHDLSRQDAGHTAQQHARAALVFG